MLCTADRAAIRPLEATPSVEAEKDPGINDSNAVENGFSKPLKRRFSQSLLGSKQLHFHADT